MISVLMIEDHKVTINGLKSFFRPCRDEINITNTSISIEDALQIDDKGSIDAIMLDLWLPSGDPTTNYQQLEKNFPGKPIVIFTSEESIRWQRTMYDLGAKGFINKKAEKPLIENTLQRIMKGETVYSITMMEYESKKELEGYKDPIFELSKEQLQILNLFMEGKTTEEIAGVAGKNVSTINKQIKKIKAIFKVNSTVDLVKKVLDLDL